MGFAELPDDPELDVAMGRRAFPGGLNPAVSPRMGKLTTILTHVRDETKVLSYQDMREALSALIRANG